MGISFSLDSQTLRSLTCYNHSLFQVLKRDGRSKKIFLLHRQPDWLQDHWRFRDRFERNLAVHITQSILGNEHGMGLCPDHEPYDLYHLWSEKSVLHFSYHCGMQT